MPFEMFELSGNLLTVKIKGILTKLELEKIQSEALSTIKKKIKIMVKLEDFMGWELGADWGDIKFAAQHDHIEKIAIVGDEKLKDLVFAYVGNPFRKLAIEYFDVSQIDKARTWIK